MSFKQIQKSTKTLTETKKEKDNNSKNNSKNQDNNQSFITKSDSINFNFSNVGIFDTEKVIQRKPIPSYNGKYSRSRPVDHLTAIPNIQTKLKISQPNDPLEKEADRVAEQIVGTNYINSNAKFGNKNKGKETINRKCSKCEKEDDDIKRN